MHLWPFLKDWQTNGQQQNSCSCLLVYKIFTQNFNRRPLFLNSSWYIYFFHIPFLTDRQKVLRSGISNQRIASLLQWSINTLQWFQIIKICTELNQIGEQVTLPCRVKNKKVRFPYLTISSRMCVCLYVSLDLVNDMTDPL